MSRSLEKPSLERAQSTMWRGRRFWEQSVLLSFLGRRRKVEETKGLQIGWPSGRTPCSDHLWPSPSCLCASHPLRQGRTCIGE